MKQFKTESKRILDLMINSIYTNKEIFLRELISNASDAIDKLHFISLTDDKVDHNFRIYIGRDKDARTLTVDDNGIGMTAEEMEKNLGTIAQSGTLAFKKEQKDPTELIGQFGVGFYSAFMVADEIEVVSRAYGSDKANKWTSRGAEGYTIEPAEKETVGTTITIRLRPKDDDFDYDKLLEEYYLRSLIKKYSDYIRYPIQMLVTKSRVKDNPDKKEGDKDEYESYTEIETINSMTPLWKKKKTEIKPEEYNEFYKAKFRDYTDPLCCSFPPSRRTTIIRRTSKKDSNFNATACLSPTNARNFCPTASGLCAAWWTAAICRLTFRAKCFSTIVNFAQSRRRSKRRSLPNSKSLWNPTATVMTNSSTSSVYRSSSACITTSE